jgi:ornithine cyclodeaminase/alanine dehydrogenase-like protein (mu-crystallin family)
MDPQYLNKEKVAALLPMAECIPLMENMFRALANGECLQPLRSLMWLPDKSGLLGMMPAYVASPNIIGIKIITIFHANGTAGYPSHQGVVILFDGQHGQPLMLFDAGEITAIRTAAASAVAARLLSRENSEHLAIIGSGEQAERHIEAILLVRNIQHIYLWGRNQPRTTALQQKLAARYSIPIRIMPTAQAAAEAADIICTVTAAAQPVLLGHWIPKGAHLNIVGSCTPHAREVDSSAVLHSSLFTDCYESLFKEAGDFLIPKKDGIITDSHVKAELGEVLTGKKAGRTTREEITLFKSLGIAAEDLYSAWHIYNKSPH